MKKLKLLVTASLLIGGCLFLSNTFNGAVTEAKAASSTFIPPETVTLNGKQYSVERVYYSDPITDGTYLFGGTGKKANTIMCHRLMEVIVLMFLRTFQIHRFLK